MYSFLTTQSKFSTTLNNTVLLTFEASKQCNVFCPNCYIPEEKRLKDKNLFDIEWLDKLKNSQNLSNFHLWFYETLVNNDSKQIA